MDKFKEIKYEIKKLSECLNCLEKAYKCLVDVDDTDEIYTKIVNIAEEVNDIKINKEVKMEVM